MPRLSSSTITRTARKPSLAQRLRPDAEKYAAARFAWLAFRLPNRREVTQEAWDEAVAENDRLERAMREAAERLASRAAIVVGVPMETPAWLLEPEPTRSADPVAEAV